MRVFIFFNDDVWKDFNDVILLDFRGDDVLLVVKDRTYLFNYSDIFNIKVIKE